MPIALPEGSLGPVPTKKQMETLKKMAVSGAVVHTWEGTRLDSHGAYIRFGAAASEKCNRNDVSKFCDWGWLESLGGDFKGHNYCVSERGLKVIAKGKTR